MMMQHYLELELELECMHAHGGIAVQQTSARRPEGHFNVTSSTSEHRRGKNLA